MDLLEDPSIRKTYDKCKYIVKVWEHTFTKKNKRIPSKLDIREAPRDVRHAYRKYFQLKTAALEQSFMDVEGFEVEETVCENVFEPSQIHSEVPNNEESSSSLKENEIAEINIPENVWGSHLNNKKESDISEEKTSQSKPNIKSTISKKLFCGSKFNKRNPRKSLSFSQKNKSNNDLDAPMFLSQPISSVSKTFTSEESISFSQKLMSNSVKMVVPLEKPSTQPVNIIQCVLENTYNRTLNTVDAEWLNRVTEQTGDNMEIASKMDYDSDEIVYDSDEEPQQPLWERMSLLHVAKKRKIEEEFLRNFENSKCTTVCKKSDLPLPNISIKTNVREDPVSKEIGGSVLEAKEDNFVSSGKIIEVHDKIEYLDANDKKETVTNSKTNEDPVYLDQQTELKRSNKEVNEMETVGDVYSFQDDLDESDTQKKTQKKKQKPRQKLTRPKKITKQKHKKLTEKNQDNSEANKIISPLRRSSRATKLKVSLEELSSGEEDPFHSENEEQDPEFTLDENNKTNKFGLIDDGNDNRNTDTSVEVEKVIKTRKGQITRVKVKKGYKQKSKEKIPKEKILPRRKVKNKEIIKEEIKDNEEESSAYELEFRVKPRIVAPRYNSVKKVLRDCKKNIADEKDITNAPKSKRQREKDLLEKKIASGNLNDNFVTVNLKKKIFSRHRSGNKFAKFKKSQWKANKKKNALCGPEMNMGGCDGERFTCFTCGQVGHFTNQCKATKGDGLLPLNGEGENIEDDCPFLTLEEASQMAKESALSVRKPRNINDNKENNDNNKVVESKGEGDSEEIDWGDDFDDEELLQETLRLEEHIKKLDVRAYMDDVKVVRPYFELNQDGTVIETPQEVLEALEKFGYKSFRPGQEKAIMRILSGKSTLVTLSTGSGKSMCYQLPAYLYSRREPCIALVISPLVSLMEDQVTGIPKFLKAACLHTNQTKTQRQRIIDCLSDGELNVLLISPEAVVAGEKQTGFGSLLRKLPPIAFACIDEAHCVSQWSHNFRPSYLMICRVLRESLGVKTILGLTATATRSTCDSIIEHLDIPDGHEGIISDIPLPDNLILTVSKDTNRDVALLYLLLSERFSKCKSIIVYCTRRDECERIASFLRTSLKSEQVQEETNNKKRKRRNLQAEPYHAGLSASRRKSIQNAFMSGALRIVVATVAFGMGINKADIRSVIHFNMPRSFESYVQEVGRAGRDGLPAHCHAFLDSQGRDENELRRHIHANSIDRHVIRKLLQKIFVPCSCKVVCPKHEVAFSIEQTVRALDIPEENISTLLCYLELHQNKYIELLSPAYTVCKVISYGGPLQIRKASRDCPPLAMALALHKTKTGEDPNVLEFSVIDVAATMGWDSGICKHKLKNLEWTAVNNQPKRSLITVTFSNLGFRMLAPGNLSDDQLDEALDSLFQKVQNQEQKALKQLRAVHETLVKVAEKSYKTCINTENVENSVLKLKVREYFDSKAPLDEISAPETLIVNEEQLVNDIRSFICMYRNVQFTGRAIARIFQGIPSPNYPAVEWGRCKFWRRYLADDFHEICRIATREVIRLR